MADADDVRAAYEKYLSSFTANDLSGIDSVVRYPLAHIADGRVLMFDSFPIDPAGLMAAKGWHTTVGSRYEVVAASPTKAHVVRPGDLTGWRRWGHRYGAPTRGVTGR